MDVDGEFSWVGRVEEEVPEGGEVEVRVGEKQEGDLEGGVGGADADRGSVIWGSTAEEGKIVEVVGEGGDGWGTWGGEDVWGEKEEEGKREEKKDCCWDQWGWR